MIGDLAAIVITVTAFVVAWRYLPSIIDAAPVPTAPAAESRVPPLAAAQTRIYSYSACALAQNYHTSPAAVHALIDDAAAALNCPPVAATTFVRRALCDYRSYERAAYWLRVEFEYMRRMAQEEGSGE